MFGNDISLVTDVKTAPNGMIRAGEMIVAIIRRHKYFTVAAFTMLF